MGKQDVDAMLNNVATTSSAQWAAINSERRNNVVCPVGSY